jgi:50S ribosomal subunit-associated GTPase HflX
MFPLNPILIALNKIDIAPPAQLERARSKFPNAYEIIAVEGTGLDSLLKDAIDEVDLKPMQESVDDYLQSLSRK